MEDVLEVYHYDPDYPVVCMDESNKQLVDLVRPPILTRPGHPLCINDEYVRKGVDDNYMEWNLSLVKELYPLPKLGSERIGLNS
jgi:hypothetical protein